MWYWWSWWSENLKLLGSPETVVSPFEDPRYKKIQAIIHYRNESPESRSLVPLKQLVLKLEIHDTCMKCKISFTQVMNLQSGEPKAAWFPWNSWFANWRSKILKWNDTEMKCKYIMPWWSVQNGHDVSWA